MKDKITYLMKSEGLTTTRLAEILEIQPSAVSHLASGRNKPSYDNLQKILRRFPRINPDWLLLDSDEPYRKDEDIFDDADEQIDSSTSDMPDSLPFGVANAQTNASQSKEYNDSSQPLFNVFPPNSRDSKSPIFVVMFYDDGSCESFSMRR
ncbi:MAG: helix-turn-helix transcriptional regulator [Rikenellaceae bacterium]